jgi:hypothetical protein
MRFREAEYLSGPVQAFGFAAIVILDIWFVAKSSRWLAFVPVLLIIWSWRRNSRSFVSLGLSGRSFREAFVNWWPWWLVLTALIAIVEQGRLLTPHFPERALLHLTWCCVQQAALQSMIYLPLREAWSRNWAALLAGSVFAVVHWPNPVLVAGTFAWGILAAALFERFRNVWVLAIMQVYLSSLLLWLTPDRWNHGFRVGPFY